MSSPDSITDRPVDSGSSTAKTKRRIFSKWFIPVNDVLEQRLLAAIDSLMNEKNSFSDHSNTEVLKTAEDALVRAKRCAGRKEFDNGWNHLFLAEQALVKLMSSSQKAIKANNLRIEAEKISGWRQKQIYMLLCEPGKLDDCTKYSVITDADKIIEALKIRNDFYNTRNHRMALRKANLNTLAWTLFIIFCSLALFTIITHVSEIIAGRREVGFSILFGALGASFSMAYTISTTDLSLKIPDQLQGIYNTTIRLLIGGTAALIALMLYRAGILNSLFSESVIKSDYTYIVISFIAGFSERWIVNLLGSVTKENDKEKAKN